MFRKLSIAFPIIGMVVFLVISISLAFYIVEINSLRDALWTKENSKAEDIYYIVESLIEREENRLAVIAVALNQHQKILNGFNVFLKSGGNVTDIKKAMDAIYYQLNIDIFQTVDTNGRLVYRADSPQKPDARMDVPEFFELHRRAYAMAVARIDKNWSILAAAPILQDGAPIGSVVIGTYLNDAFAKKIAFETEGHVSFGSLDGIIASSLPFDQRIDIVQKLLRECILEVKSIRQDHPESFKVIHYSPMEVSEKLFGVMVEIDTKSSFELMRENKKHILRFAVVILLIAISLGAIFTVYLVGPLKRLQIKARETVRDISGVDLKEDRGNEIQNMIRLFDALVATATDHIAERIDAEDALKKQQEHLEDQIAIRTAELRKANQKLRITVGELEHRTNQTLLFNQIGDLLQACDSEAETYSIIARFCRKIFPDDAGYLSIFDKTQKQLKVVATWGDNGPKDNEFGPNQCWAIRLGGLHMVKNPEIDPLCPHLKDYTNDSYICAPMIAQGELLGMIHLRFARPEDPQDEPKQDEAVRSKQLLVTSILEHYAPPLTNLRLRETLKIQSIHDPLTGLYNRRHLTDTLESETRRAKRHGTSLGIIMVDVDHFKKFNDAYTHEAGDAVLIELAKFLKDCIRQEDIACRYGGEEFVLILPETTLENANQRAEDLRQKIEAVLSIQHQNRIFKITVSMGVAAFPHHGPTTDIALKAADAALYMAKASGRNCVMVAEERQPIP